MRKLEALYHRLPYPLRVVAASAHGLRLQPLALRIGEEASSRGRWTRINERYR